MKKLICALLCAVIISAPLTLPGYADSCSHEYKSEHFDKNCVSPARTVYTCEKCPDSYTVYDWEYSSPENFALLYESERDDVNMTLTVRVYMLNNPGLLVARTRLGYNPDTLKAISYENGTVWEDDDYFKNVDITTNPVTVYTEEKTDVLNKKCGLYFTFVYSILDPDGDYGFTITANKSDFSDDMYQPHLPDVINLIGKRIGRPQLFLPETVVEPTFDTVGQSVCRCVFCNAEQFSDIPVLEHWRIGDVNNDKKLNVSDALLLKKIIVGKLDSSILQMRDAADINHDNKINVADAIAIKKLIVGYNVEDN